MTDALSIEEVDVRRGQALAISNVSFSVRSTTWFGVIGANGAGKTSLLRSVAGRLDFAAGQCHLNGSNLTYNRQARAEAIGFAPPASALPAALRTEEVLRLAARDSTDPVAILGALGEAIDITALLSSRIGILSAGMRQRVAIACAFVGGQETVILDEPFNWLDPVAAYDLRIALRQRVDAGLTLITALHDMPTLASSCDEGLLLVDGRVALSIDQGTLRDGQADISSFEHRMIDVLRSGGSALTFSNVGT